MAQETAEQVEARIASYFAKKRADDHHGHGHHAHPRADKYFFVLLLGITWFCCVKAETFSRHPMAYTIAIILALVYKGPWGLEIGAILVKGAAFVAAITSGMVIWAYASPFIIHKFFVGGVASGLDLATFLISTWIVYYVLRP